MERNRRVQARLGRRVRSEEEDDENADDAWWVMVPTCRVANHDPDTSTCRPTSLDRSRRLGRPSMALIHAVQRRA